MAVPTSVLASHISSRGPPQCHAQHPGGHTALHRCRSCTRFPRLFLHNIEGSSSALSLVKHVSERTMLIKWLLTNVAHQRQKELHSLLPTQRQCLLHFQLRPATVGRPSVHLQRITPT